jgi:hypothetical protein
VEGLVAMFADTDGSDGGTAIAVLIGVTGTNAKAIIGLR